MSAFLQDVKPLSDEELQKLGIKVSLNIIYYLQIHTKKTLKYLMIKNELR